MKLYTSYWAQLRHFPKNLVALSTVVWDPKWYQVGGKDKNGVISLHCSPLRPGPRCNGLCRGSCNPKHPDTCSFLKEYRKQLDELNFKDFIDHLLNLRELILSENPELDDVDFAFIVFETPSNPCSERVVIQQWFKDNGMEITEWMKMK